jgi:hypothetical protein
LKPDSHKVNPVYNCLLVSTYELGHQPFGLAEPAAVLRQIGAVVRRSSYVGGESRDGMKTNEQIIQEITARCSIRSRSKIRFAVCRCFGGAVLSASRIASMTVACFIKAYPAETTEAFLDGHVSAFAFFGGVPLSILYDNLKIAVARILGDGKRQRTHAFT